MICIFIFNQTSYFNQNRKEYVIDVFYQLLFSLTKQKFLEKMNKRLQDNNKKKQFKDKAIIGKKIYIF